MIFLLHQVLRRYFLIGKSTSRALVSLDPEGEGGVVVSPHLIDVNHWIGVEAEVEP